jgi:hypothetical protein
LGAVASQRNPWTKPRTLVSYAKLPTTFVGIGPYGKSRVNMRTLPFACAIATAAVCAVGSMVSASTIEYTDSFNRNGTLNGSSPDVSSPSATWTAYSAFSTSTSPVPNANTTPAYSPDAFLPFSVGLADIATETVTLTPTGGDDNWLALGFMQGTSAGGFLSTAEGFVLYRGSGQAVAFTGSGTNGEKDGNSASVGGTPDTFTITLNNTNPANPTISFTDTLGLDDVIDAPYGGSTSAIDAVAIATLNEPGSYTAFSATDIPEPAPLGMITLVSSGVLLARKRRCV